MRKREPERVSERERKKIVYEGRRRKRELKIIKNTKE